MDFAFVIWGVYLFQLNLFIIQISEMNYNKNGMFK